MPASRRCLKLSLISELIFQIRTILIKSEHKVTGLLSRLRIWQFTLAFYCGYFCFNQSGGLPSPDPGLPVFGHRASPMPVLTFQPLLEPNEMNFISSDGGLPK